MKGGPVSADLVSAGLAHFSCEAHPQNQSCLLAGVLVGCCGFFVLICGAFVVSYSFVVTYGEVGVAEQCALSLCKCGHVCRWCPG